MDFVIAYLDRREHGMCLADYSYHDGTLLDCFLCIFDLEDTTLGREGHRIVVVVVSEHDGSGSCALVIEGCLS